ncbi:MAG: hypothetical protein HOL85_14850 [Rhodospirillaceae bacterium]|nr:hypothetical protein [Rhodospirillaceae bacterium]
MSKQFDDAPVSLFGGVDRLVTDYLGIANHRHWSAVLALCDAPPATFDGALLVKHMFSTVSANWLGCLEALERPPSRQNWRWFDPKPDISPHNTSPEVTLERALIAAALVQGRRDWSNQVPIASGMAGSGDRRRAIDLVHERGPGTFDFVELKIASDNPLFAAIEILEYGLVWLLSRQHRASLGYVGRPPIEATEVRLSVLAPSAYYRELDLSWLADGLDVGLRELGKREGGVNLAFAFEAFPPRFSWPAEYSDAALCGLLDGRLPR